jgi:hypothetical protein
MVKQVSSCSGISSGFRVFFIFSAILALTSTALAGSGQLISNPSNLDFGSVQIGSSQTRSLTLTNSGNSRLIITQATPSVSGFTISGLVYPVTLSAGRSINGTVAFTPQSVGTSNGSVLFVFHDRRDAGGTFTMTLPTSGSGFSSGPLTSTPTSLSFGNVATGSNASLTETLTNSGGTSVAVSALAASGSGFAASGLTLPATLTAGQSVSFSVMFSPTSTGSATGSLAITSNATNSALYVPLSGTGLTPGQLTAAAASLSFGSVATGSNTSLTETLTNSGGTSVAISALAATGFGFTVSGLTLPATLTAGQSVSFSVKFSPTSSGSATGSLAVTSNASNSALNIPLSGTGLTPGQLTAAPASLSFGSVATGSNASLTETLTNSGGTSVAISALGATGSGFTASGLTLPATLTAGQSATFSVKFSPASSGSVTGSLAITSNASNSALNVPLSGTGITPGQLTAAPASLSFGSIATGSNASLTETLSNSGGSALTISQIISAGTGFAFSGITPPLTLNPAQSVTFPVSFAPQSVGSATGSLTITSNASNPAVSVALTGTGTGTVSGQLAVAPSSINFGSITMGTTQNQTGTLSATSGPVIVSSLGVSGSQFLVSGIAFPVTIPAGSSVPFQVAFTPTVAGTSTANITLTSNASNSPSVESLTGSGTAPQHSVGLGWNTSTSSGVTGYNIYRASASAGPFTRLNSTLDATPFDTDSTVKAGQTYYYVVTAVSSTGTESTYSNEVQVAIPTP